MKKKILAIFVCMLLIITIMSITGSVIAGDEEDPEIVDVTGTSKGRGFAGVIKRHNFHRQPQTHGTKNTLRHPGSIGQASDPSRVFKGMKMAGRMGGGRVKVINLQIVKIISDKNLVLVKGAVPGPNGSYVIIERWS